MVAPAVPPAPSAAAPAVRDLRPGQAGQGGEGGGAAAAQAQEAGQRVVDCRRPCRSFEICYKLSCKFTIPLATVIKQLVIVTVSNGKLHKGPYSNDVYIERGKGLGAMYI